MRHSRLLVWRRSRNDLWNNTYVCVLHKPRQGCVQVWISTYERRWTKTTEHQAEGNRGTTAPTPLLLTFNDAFLRAFRRCQGVILHSQTWCTASTSILTRSALAREIGSPRRTTAIASSSSSSVLADINLHASSSVQSGWRPCPGKGGPANPPATW